MNQKDFLKLVNDGENCNKLDEVLGLKANLKSTSIEIEEAYADGLTGSEALYTSYKDLLTIYQDIKQRGLKSFADLGAGHCRSKIFFDFIGAPFQSYAYELVPERIAGAKDCYQNLGLSFTQGFIEGDVTKKDLTDHDAFLLYLPVGPTLEILVNKFKELSCSKNIYLYVIESHGDLIDYLKDSLGPLRLRKSYPLHSQRHLPELYVFELESCLQQISDEQNLKKAALKELEKNENYSLKELSSQEKLFLFKELSDVDYLQLLISEDDFEWLACLKGWRYGIQKDTIETIYPYRIHYLDKIESIIVPSNVVLPYIKERRDILKPPLSSVRKIKVSPTLGIERANGVFEEL